MINPPNPASSLFKTNDVFVRFIVYHIPPTAAGRVPPARCRINLKPCVSNRYPPRMVQDCGLLG